MPSTSSFLYLCWMCVGLGSVYTNIFIEGKQFSAPAFQTAWMPIKNGLRHIARIDVPHGLNEVPVLVDVSVKVDENIFPAAGFRPDHPVEMSGPVVYIYNDRFVNVSTSPNTDSLYQIIPTSTNFYSGIVKQWNGPVYVRVRAWTRSSLPPPDFEKSGIFVKAKTGTVSDSYAEVSHGIDTIPCLVVTRAKMSHPADDVLVYADGVGSSMGTYNNVTGMTNAYLVYGYSSSNIRIWVDASPDGAIFDGRKHTWFDFVINNGEVEMFVWTCSTLTPMYNQTIPTIRNQGVLPRWWNVQTGYDLEHSLVRIVAEAEEEMGANKGFRFPASMYLAYPGDSIDGYQSINAEIGGLSYTYKELFKIEFWKPNKQASNSVIFIGSTLGNGRNTESSNSELVHVLNWMTEEDSDCRTPVIYKAFIDGAKNVSSQNATAQVECISGYHLVESQKHYNYPELEENVIKCDKYGLWVNVPTCEPNEKELGETCNPAEDTCREVLARCVLTADKTKYHCQCMDNYKAKNSHCTTDGTFLSEPDFDSKWIGLRYSYYSDKVAINHASEHMLGETPIFVDVRIEVDDHVFPVLGFRPDSDNGFDPTTVFIYDDEYINVTGLQFSSDPRIVTMYNTRWTGWSSQWGMYGRIRVQAWKAKTLPDPDFMNTSTQLRANTTGSDSFAEVFHQLGEYPGIIVVRAKMLHDERPFYAHGVGSALNVFYNLPGVTNSYLVYGFNDESVRMWVDSSSDGVIFDGRKTTLFNFTASEAVVEIFAWKISTITPYVTQRFTLHDYNVPYEIALSTTYERKEVIDMVWVEIDEPNSVHKGYRFPGSTYLADRFGDRINDECVFGGFMYGISSQTYSDASVVIYKPDTGSWRNAVKGSTVCIPKTFGNGQKTGSASNGVGILYSWINPECGTPEVENGHIDTSVNGTYIGAVAMVVCDEGYHANRQFIECRKFKLWSYSECRIDECDMPNPPDNGTMTVYGYGHFGGKLTFTCEDGFDLVGNEVIKCQAGGTWSNATPYCELQTTFITSTITSSVTSASPIVCLIQLMIMLQVVSI